MAIKDIFAEGINSGQWSVINAATLEEDLTLEADIAIVGTGAGGGTAAEILAKAGLKVIMIEHGPLKSSNDFNMAEGEAYSSLYQESAARMNKSGSITLLQGRTVGGSTTINWTSSFRTPEQTLNYWTDYFDVKDISAETMHPWFTLMEQRLNIAHWQAIPNHNNDILRKGCEKLGYSWKAIPRNVRGCWNLGYCGTGCPTNAKQGMLVTTIPTALDNKARLVFFCQAQRFLFHKDSVKALECLAMDKHAAFPNGKKVFIQAKHYVAAGGAINTPALLLRSDILDPYNLVGKRTFIHPVVASMAQFPHKIAAYSGAPQSIYSDQFQWRQGTTDPMGYKLEALPLHPALTGTLFGSRGRVLTERMEQYPNTNCLLALLRDGFHPESQGGRVFIRKDGSGLLDYELSEYAWAGAKQALLTQAEIQFAAGARKVMPLHQDAGFVSSMKGAREQLNTLKMTPFLTRVGSAHLMGGCPMSENPKTGVVNSLGEHHHIDNLSIMDGSVFPTSIGANPQLSVYGLVAKFASYLGKKLKTAA
ncbi:GMC family oxidoreductase [Endozoicomonas sp. Mp262]|uniref:GMC family oxidoreductase n=1 Tax=Endozoicomonas sp. Mp262 TaxID=2919499 RepID=UPI0021DA1616